MESEDFITINTILFQKLATELEITDEDHLHIVVLICNWALLKIPTSWSLQQIYCLKKVTEIAGIKNVALIPACVAAALDHRHFDITKGFFKDQEQTCLFVDFGATQLSYYLVRYHDVSPSCFVHE